MSQIVGLTATWQQDKVEGIPWEQILQVMLKQTPTQCTQSSTSFYETMIAVKFSFQITKSCKEESEGEEGNLSSVMVDTN